MNMNDKNMDDKNTNNDKGTNIEEATWTAYALGELSPEAAAVC